MKNLWSTIYSLGDTIEEKMSSMTATKQVITLSYFLSLAGWLMLGFLRLASVVLGYPRPSYVAWLDFWWAWLL